ncbi:glycoside hydrolase family 3 N-terminal domain-containing protein [Lutibacter citreus]|uniref:glycoside hydrolase family 3 N-terminal domain-containing protein n=1 Tax=Lutibacter citreus TaxID=2138210 RepID=UPI000DBE5452|nr:glycoside hydrolase family 3 N-terminal domain-containing protein [Lutibacter citreus]
MKYILKKSYQLLLVAFVLLVACKQKETQPKNTEVTALVSKMTLEEKVGQMTQITLSTFYKKGVFQEEKFKKYIISNGIGSILNVNESEPLSVEEWHELITKIQDYAKETRLQIPVLYGIDAIHGATYTKEATLFPHNIGLAASRNPKLAFEIAEITAKEVRASGIRWNFDPVLGVGRQPLWPRFEETFGEDVLLVSEFGTQAIKGYEGTDLKNNKNVASCMKHFLGYSVPQSGKDRTPAYIPEIVLREIFMPPFKKAVETGCPTIMINSGSINGVPVHINKTLLTDLLKNEWGFKGLVVTDWEDIMYLYKEHNVAKDNKEAVKMAINAGIEMSMVPGKLDFYNDLIELVNEGEVSMERIDDAVSRILKVKFDLGLFDNPYPEKEAVANFGLASYKETALKTAEQSMTLLKNETINNKPVLPLNKNSKVLIAGPGANSLATLHGSWSYTWQGDREHLYAESTLTIKEAIQNKIGKENVTSIAPNKFQEITTSEIKSVTQKAKNVDCIILCLGEISYAETRGNIDDLELSKDQIELAKAAIATNKPVILVLTEGRPRIVNEFIEGIVGVLMAYRPGSEGANAIANVLFGDYNPSGKLPFSYPKYSGNLLTYDAPIRNIKTYKPQWAFGEGLSYTSFEFGEIELSSKTLNENGSLTVKVKVSNTGKMDGDLVIDLFVKDLVASIIPPMKKLRKFDRVHLKAGESKAVEFILNKDDLSFVNAYLKRVTENGEFEILIGNKAVKFNYN